MKKVSLLKKILCFSPVVISPIIMAASCNSDNSVVDNFYLSYFGQELKSTWSKNEAAINAIATSATHSYNLNENILIPTLAACKATGAEAFNQAFSGNNSYDADTFNNVSSVFTISSAGSSNLRILNNILTVYPKSILASDADYTINFTLTLKNKNIKGEVKINVAPGFLKYNLRNKLHSNYVRAVYGSKDMSEILVGEWNEGLEIGNRQKDGSYDFTEYGSEYLSDTRINSVYGNADLSTILVGTYSGGLYVGNKESDGKYQFTNYNMSSSSPLISNDIYGLRANADFSKIILSTSVLGDSERSGVCVGTKQSGGEYTFKNYTADDSALIGGSYYSLIASSDNDLSTILVSTSDEGIQIGKLDSVSGGYSFSTLQDGLKSKQVVSLSATNNLATILVGENGGGLDVGTRQADGTYNFDNYSTPVLADNEVSSSATNQDASKILVGLNNGLDVGTKQADGKYTFVKYGKGSTPGIQGSTVQELYANSDLSNIIIPSNSGNASGPGGIDISTITWF